MAPALAAEVTLYEVGPPTVHPLYGETPADRRAQELVFDWLFYRSARTGEWVSALVREQRLSSDGRALELTLRDDVTWHDGERLDAKDVCFTVAALRDPATPSRLARSLREGLAGCAVQGDRAVIQLAEVYDEPREHLVFAVLPQHRFQGTALGRGGDFEAAPVGTGPMRVQIEGSDLRFTPHPSPHHPALHASPGLRLVVGGDPLLQVRTVLRAPDVLGMVQVPPPYRPDLASEPDIVLTSHETSRGWLVALDTREGPTRDVRVRQAIAATLDRRELLQRVMGDDLGENVRALLSGPQGASAADERLEIPPVQPSAERAAALLLEAGAVREQGGKRRWMLGDQPVRLKIGVHRALEIEAKGMSAQIAAQLREGGFEVELDALTGEAWLASVLAGRATHYDALVGQWSVGRLDESALLHSRQGQRGALNPLGFSDSRVDELLERLDQTWDEPERVRLYRELNALLADALPYLFLWQQAGVSAWRGALLEKSDPPSSPLPFLSDRPAWAQILPSVTED